jgi:FkbM family methyltransferase
MKKIIFIAPHLSTGGLPQYLLKKIQALINDYEISLIEYSDVTGGVLVVQRNQLKEIIPSERFYTIGNDKNEVIEIINRIDPYLVHLEEMPEYFIDYEIAKKIYDPNRKYKIFETSHDSSFDSKNKKFFPDKFLLVSNYQVEMLKDLNTPSVVVEYPIEYKNRIPKEEALKILGLDSTYKHVINVGLFTPRKNQKEVFEYAKNLKEYKIKFHFIGNQADNFKFYWEPLLKDAPENCIIWGERSDVEIFYSIADLFLFTSRGFSSDKETSPLVIKEAIGYRVPSLIYNLPVYQGMYDKYSNINYLSTEENNEDKILNILRIPKINNTDVSIIIDDNVDSLKEKILQKVLKMKEEKQIPFDVTFDENENKIYFTLNKDSDQTYGVSIKDIDSKACIFYSEIGPAQKGFQYWMMPLPKSVIDFKNSPKFGGFTVEFLDSNGDIVGLSEKRYKELPFEKPNMDITNTEPIFMNYEEFFIDRVYDILDIKNPGIVMDIGANLGVWTKYILYRGAEKVYCFEPNKKAIEHLKKTLSDDSNTRIIEKAVYKENSILKFFIDEKNSLTSSLLEQSGHSPAYDVEAITLEESLDLIGESKVDLIKIDIEGAEFDIIDRMDNKTAERINSLLIEYHDFYFPEGMAKVQKMENKLKSMGYKIYRCPIPAVKYVFAKR